MTKNLVQKSASLELQKAEINQTEDGYKFTGYASVFNGVDAYGDTILPGAFADCLKGATPKMFFNHKTYDMPIGKWTLLKEDEKGLYVEGELIKGLKVADDVALAMKAGAIDGLSIGFWVDEDSIKYNEYTDGFVIGKIERLVEISVVTFPADDSARIEKAESLDSLKDIERYLRDAGLSAREAKAVISRTKSVVLDEKQRDVENEKATNEILERLHQIDLKLSH